MEDWWSQVVSLTIQPLFKLCQLYFTRQNFITHFCAISDQMVNSSLVILRYDNGFAQLVQIIQDDQEIGYQYRGDMLRHSSSMKKYLRGSNLIAGETGGVLYYYVINEHGDVVQLQRTDGTCKAAYVYDSYGKENNPDEEDENPFWYCGE